MNAKDLRKAVKRLGTTAVARAAGMKPQTIDSWLNNSAASMKQENHEKVVKAVAELLSDGGENGPDEMPKVVQLGNEHFYPVPVYDIRAAAGAGALAEDTEPASYQVFRAGFVERLTGSPLDALSVIEVTGDSMEPTMYGGDQVLVDRSIRSVTHDGIYILRLDDAVIVKRCAKDYATKAIQIISDNEKYPMQTVKSSERLAVIGRVIWIGRALR